MWTLATRGAAAGHVLADGGVQFLLWLAEYRGEPLVGPLFLADVLATAVIAVDLVALPGGGHEVAALALSVAALVGFLLVCTPSLAGFEGPEIGAAAALATAAKAGTVVVAGLWFRAAHPTGYSAASRSTRGTSTR